MTKSSGRGGGSDGGDIWAPFRRKDGSVPRPLEWIRDWARRRPNPYPGLSQAKMGWSMGRAAFEQARDKPHTGLGQVLRGSFARDGVRFGADGAVRFDPDRVEGSRHHLAPEFRTARRLDQDGPRAGEPLGRAERRPASAGETLGHARRGGAARAGTPLKGGTDETLAGGTETDRAAVPDQSKSSATRRKQGRERIERLDRIEDEFRRIAKQVRPLGFEDTADNIEHFLGGSGQKRVISREDARTRGYIRNGEEENRNRFVRRSFLGLDGGINQNIDDKLRSLQDRETISFNDRWNRDLKTKEDVAPALEFDDVFAIGASNFDSTGHFTASRHGDVIVIEGSVNTCGPTPTISSRERARARRQPR